MSRRTRRLTATFGLSALAVFALSFVAFSLANAEFDVLNDYVSALGAVGQPHASGWNLVGFGAVGLLLMAFGWQYGRAVDDRLVCILFSLFGFGFAATAIPVDLSDMRSALSKAHIVAITLALAAWLFGLARLSGMAALERRERWTAHLAAVCIVVPVGLAGLGLVAMPVADRLVFLVVFGWIGVTSVRMLTDVRREAAAERAPGD